MILFLVFVAGVVIGLILGLCIRADIRDHGLFDWDPEQ